MNPHENRMQSPTPLSEEKIRNGPPTAVEFISKHSTDRDSITVGSHETALRSNTTTKRLKDEMDKKEQQRRQQDEHDRCMEEIIMAQEQSRKAEKKNSETRWWNSDSAILVKQSPKAKMQEGRRISISSFVDSTPTLRHLVDGLAAEEVDPTKDRSSGTTASVKKEREMKPSPRSISELFVNTLSDLDEEGVDEKDSFWKNYKDKAEKKSP